jgi:outer membrane beta-barrel protein
MRLLPLCIVALLAAPVLADPEPSDTISAVQKRPLRQAHRLELWSYGQMSIADPYLQRWGGGLRAMWHVREGLSFGLDASGLGTWATEELVIAKRELNARILESRERAAVAAMASIAPLYGKVALPGDALIHFETFLDAGMGAAFTETDAGRGVRPMITGGIGQRIFLGEDFALTARLGGNLYAERILINGVPSTKAMGFWSLALGVSFYFGGSR